MDHNYACPLLMFVDSDDCPFLPEMIKHEVKTEENVAPENYAELNLSDAVKKEETDKCEKLCSEEAEEAILDSTPSRNFLNLPGGDAAIVSDGYAATVKTETVKDMLLNKTSYDVAVKGEESATYQQIRDFLCEICNSTFKNKKELQYHMDAYHTADKPYSCQHCSKAFSSLVVLNRHVRAHSLTQYPVCQKRVTNARSHKCHVNTFHIRDKTCQHCNKTLTDSGLRRHMIRFHGASSKIVCDICDCYFARKESLVSHMIQTHGTKSNFICTICDQIYVTRSGLKRHQLKCNSNGRRSHECPNASEFETPENAEHVDIGQKKEAEEKNEIHSAINFSCHCKICQKQFRNSVVYKYHMIRWHGATSNIFCEICDCYFVSRKDLESHMNQVHDIKSHLNCTFCSQSYASQSGLRRHMLKCSSNGQRSHEFSATFRPRAHDKAEYIHIGQQKEDALGSLEPEELVETTHMQDPSEMKYLKCKDSTFKSRDGLQNHIDAIPSDKPYSCQHCTKRFLTKEGLKYHMNSLHTADNPHVCEHCLKSCASASALLRHVNSVHKQIKNFICETCGFTFTTKYGLDKHTDSFHSDKLYTCQHCTKSFARLNLLQKHVKIHSADYKVTKNFVCETCGCKFRTNCKLQLHIGRHHITEKPHTCQHCSKKFTSLYVLHRHSTVHRPTSSYSITCNVCLMKFRTNTIRELHMINHHGAKTSHVCKECNRYFISTSSLKRHTSKHCQGQIM